MRNIPKLFLGALIIGTFMVFPILSYADDHDTSDHDRKNHDVKSHEDKGHETRNREESRDEHEHDHGHHDHDYHERSYVSLGFSSWPNNYYYGTTYYPPADDVFVTRPSYQAVIINGTMYYLNDGTYYIYNGYGYQPVAPPALDMQRPAVVDNQLPLAASPIEDGAPSDMPDAFTINIPNDKGGFTAVTLKKSGDGFIGPQGEFYREFPKVSQLKVIYGK